jgi:hypothetical protein
MNAPNEMQPVCRGLKGLAGSYAPRRKTGRLFRSLGMAFDFVERLPPLHLDHSRLVTAPKTATGWLRLSATITDHRGPVSERFLECYLLNLH